MKEQTLCKNCGESTNGNYCSNCGQKTATSRLNADYLLDELTNSLFQLQHGFFYTLKELFLNPAKSITEFLNGKRKKYFKPLSYLLILSTFYYLVTLTLDANTWIDDFLTGFNEGIKENNDTTPAILTWFSKHYAYTVLLLLPIFSLASYLSFYKFKKNYVEHIFINSYVTAQQSIIYSFFALLGLVVKHESVEIAPFLVSVSYNFYVYYKLFVHKIKILNLLRSLLTYLIYLLLSAVFFIVVLLISKI